MPKILGLKDGASKAQTQLQKKDNLWFTQKTFENTYFVLSDTLADTEDTILGAVGVPSLWSALRGCLCKEVSADEIQRVVHPITGVPAILWEATAKYDSNIDADEEQDDDPIAKTPTIRWHGETEEEVLEEDAITGDPVETKAKEPILLTTPFVMPVLEIKRYETYPFDPNVILDYSHRTNSAAFWGAPAGSALFLPPEVDEETIEQVKYAVVTYRIKFKIKPGVDEPWKARVLHHGFKYRKKAGEAPEVYTDKHGNPATVNLNDDGTLLPDGQPAKFLEFNRFKKANFNALTLGPF